MTDASDPARGFPRLLAEGLWVVGTHHFNLYLVKGLQASALIEVGVSAVVDDVIRQMEHLGIHPDFLVVTHPHADHITGLAGLKERYPQALVVAGEGAPEFVAHPKAAEALVIEDRHTTQFLDSRGLKPGRPSVLEPPTLENCLVAHDGDEMDLGGLTLRFLSVGGHSPAQIAVSIPELRALVLSDAIGFRFRSGGLFPAFLMDYSQYMSTLGRLEALEPHIVGPAHQGPICGVEEVKQAFQQARRLAMALQSRIAADTRDAELIASELLQDYYREEMLIFTEESIRNCLRLVVKRARESSASVS